MLGRLVILTCALVGTSLLNASGPATARMLGAPVISGWGDRSVTATSACAPGFCAVVDLSAGITVSEAGYSASQLSFDCNVPNGTTTAVTLASGTGVSTCTAHDPAGGFSQVQFHVTVTVPPPTFQNVPGPITTQATGASGAVVTFVKPTASDVAGGSPVVTCDQTSGIAYPIGTTTVTCSATIMRLDSVGSPISYTSGSTQFTITVTSQQSTGGGTTTTTTAAPTTTPVPTTTTPVPTTTTSPAPTTAATPPPQTTTPTPTPTPTTTTTSTTLTATSPGGESAPSSGSSDATPTAAPPPPAAISEASSPASSSTPRASAATTPAPTSAATASDVTLSAPAVTRTKGGAAVVSFTTSRLSAKAVLVIALLTDRGETITRFSTAAHKGVNAFSAQLPAMQSKRGTRVRLQVTVTADGKRHTISKLVKI